MKLFSRQLFCGLSALGIIRITECPRFFVLKAKKEFAKELAESNPAVDWEGVDLKELNESRWERIVQVEMRRLKKKECDIAKERKAADWKVGIAKRLRRGTTAKNPWIAKRLEVGHPSYVSNLINKA